MMNHLPPYEGCPVDPCRCVFVFGSNEAGIHGAGAAYAASVFWGAKRGEGHGFTGNAYAIPTKDKDLKKLVKRKVERYVAEFKEEADALPDVMFYVSRVGTGLAGFKDAEIALMFEDAPTNCILPFEWNRWARRQNIHLWADDADDLDARRRVQSWIYEQKNVETVGFEYDRTLDNVFYVQFKDRKKMHVRSLWHEQESEMLFCLNHDAVTGTLGWAAQSNEEYLAYYFTSTHALYWIPWVGAFQDWLEKSSILFSDSQYRFEYRISEVLGRPTLIRRHLSVPVEMLMDGYNNDPTTSRKIKRIQL